VAAAGALSAILLRGTGRRGGENDESGLAPERRNLEGTAPDGSASEAPPYVWQAVCFHCPYVVLPESPKVVSLSQCSINSKQYIQ
jgi:hypothetical protein